MSFVRFFVFNFCFSVVRFFFAMSFVRFFCLQFMFLGGFSAFFRPFTLHFSSAVLKTVCLCSLCFFSCCSCLIMRLYFQIYFLKSSACQGTRIEGAKTKGPCPKQKQTSIFVATPFCCGVCVLCALLFRCCFVLQGDSHAKTT